jgi:hypothetical protein
MAFHWAFVPSKVMEVKYKQLRNAHSPILVTLSGMVMEVKP